MQTKIDYAAKLKEHEARFQEDPSPSVSGALTAVRAELETTLRDIERACSSGPSNKAALPAWRKHLLLFLPEGKIGWALHALLWGGILSVFLGLLSWNSDETVLGLLLSVPLLLAGRVFYASRPNADAFERVPIWKAILLWYSPSTASIAFLHVLFWMLLAVLALCIGVAFDDQEVTTAYVAALMLLGLVSALSWRVARHGDRGCNFEPDAGWVRRILGLYPPTTAPACVCLGFVGLVTLTFGMTAVNSRPVGPAKLMGFVILFGLLRLVAYCSEEAARRGPINHKWWERTFLLFPPQRALSGITFLLAYVFFAGAVLTSLGIAKGWPASNSFESLSSLMGILCFVFALHYSTRCLAEVPSIRQSSGWRRALGLYTPNRQVVWTLQLLLWVFILFGMLFIVLDEDGGADSNSIAGSASTPIGNLPVPPRSAEVTSELNQGQDSDSLEQARRDGEIAGALLGEALGDALGRWFFFLPARNNVWFWFVVLFASLRFYLYALERYPPGQLSHRSLAQELLLFYLPRGWRQIVVHTSYYLWLLVIFGFQIPTVWRTGSEHLIQVSIISVIWLGLIQRTGRAMDLVVAQPEPEGSLTSAAEA